ncbi:MAG: right-handed parallel beta-helix repeat-containing protein, partial [Candidatus Micrarchaeota archaeon]
MGQKFVGGTLSLLVLLLIFGCLGPFPQKDGSKSEVSAAFGNPPPIEQGVTCNPPEWGEWNVTGEEVCSNGVIIVNGNLSIREGGSLTLRNVTLHMNGTDNFVTLRVYEGGSLYVYDNDSSPLTMDDASNITNYTNFAFAVRIDDGANFVMENSEMSKVGYINYDFSACRSEAGYWKGFAGPIIRANNSRIINSTFTRNQQGLIASADNMTLEGNLFFGNNIKDLYICNASSSRFVNNSLASGGYDAIIIGDEARDNVIENNSLVGGTDGIQLLLNTGGNNTFIRNNITSSGSHGVNMASGVAGGKQIFDSNIISGSGIAGWWIGGSTLADYDHFIYQNNTIDGEPIYYYTNPAYVVIEDLNTSSSTTMRGGGRVNIINGSGVVLRKNNVSNNRYDGGSIYESNIFVAFSSNVTIFNNTLANSSYGVLVKNSTNVNIVNNTADVVSRAGFRIEGGRDNYLEGNNATNASTCGFWPYYTTRLNMTGNNVTGAENAGICLHANINDHYVHNISADNDFNGESIIYSLWEENVVYEGVLKNASCSGNTIGKLVIVNGRNVTVRYSTFENNINAGHGVVVANSTGVKIFNNTFTNNACDVVAYNSFYLEVDNNTAHCISGSVSGFNHSRISNNSGVLSLDVGTSFNATILNSTFSDGSVAGTYTYCNFSQNRIVISTALSISISSCTFANNTVSGGGEYFEINGNGNNTIIWNLFSYIGDTFNLNGADSYIAYNNFTNVGVASGVVLGGGYTHIINNTFSGTGVLIPGG